MKSYLLVILLFATVNSFAQHKLPDLFGYRHLQTVYKGDTVDILVRSKKGDEQKKKGLFLFCQGSLPVPLIITYERNGKTSIYPVFVFDPDSLANEYHLVIIGKPYTPLIADERTLNTDLSFSDSTAKFPSRYIERNLLDYYVGRNIAVISFLQQQAWVSNDKLVVAGHSEGSTIAAKLAYRFPKVTHLIYSGGNPCGRIVTMIEQQRAHETDSLSSAENVFINWKNIVQDPGNMDGVNGDSYKATYQFSEPPMDYISKLKIPVLVTYGTKDYGAPFNDYFRVKMIADKRKNIFFKAYIGLEHNFFPLKSTGETNFDIFNWNIVANDWRNWLKHQ
jgi:dienelactone hydrolase